MPKRAIESLFSLACWASVSRASPIFSDSATNGARRLGLLGRRLPLQLGDQIDDLLLPLVDDLLELFANVVAQSQLLRDLGIDGDGQLADKSRIGGR